MYVSITCVCMYIHRGSGHLPEYRNVRVLNAKAKAKAARGQQQG